jgi:hypothetical protein
METIPLTFTPASTQKIMDATHDPKINGLMGAVDSPIYLMFRWLSKNAPKNEFVDGKLTLSIPYKLAADFLASLLIMDVIAPKHGFRQMALEANSLWAAVVQKSIQTLLGQMQAMNDETVRDESHRWN